MLNSAHNQRLLKISPGWLFVAHELSGFPDNQPSKGIDYYMIDLRNTDINMVMDIIDECAIGARVLESTRVFPRLYTKMRYASYAVINNRIAGFAREPFFMIQFVYTATMKPWALRKLQSQYRQKHGIC